MTQRDLIAAVLSEHQFKGQARPSRRDADEVLCRCGAVVAYHFAEPSETNDARMHRLRRALDLHRADALIAAGVTMPEPSAFCGPGCFSRPCPNCPEGEE